MPLFVCSIKSRTVSVVPLEEILEDHFATAVHCCWHSLFTKKEDRSYQQTDCEQIERTQEKSLPDDNNNSRWPAHHIGGSIPIRKGGCFFDL
jgi:hypothetical protein